MAETLVFQMFKKGGFVPILSILYDNPAGLTLPDFIQGLIQHRLYYNAYYRLKDQLIAVGLIDFKVNGDKDRVIYLPPKGIAFLEYIRKAQLLLKEVQPK